ncbi:MAG: hypothetical protein N2489_02085 [Clostridia bacterium]|nr:hypothetical protein [Clostridia bacterium]
MVKPVKRTAAFFLITVMIISIGSVAAGSNPYLTGYVEGFFKGAAGQSKVQIEDYDGIVHTLDVNTNTAYLIDQREVKLSVFKPGLEVYGRLTGRTLSSLEGYSTSNMGYIQPGSRIRTGTVKKIDRDQIIVSLPTGDQETYFSSSATIVTKKGVNASLNALYEGDGVRLYFDEANSFMISRMEIQGDSILIKDLYKGRLGVVDQYDNAVTITGVEIFKNAKWQPLQSSLRISCSDEAAIYIAGRKVPLGNLKQYAGKTFYMAVKNFFGKSRVEKMVLANQYESVYIDKISEINWFTGAFELAGRKNIAFNESSIIVRNGRLVDQYALNPLSDAFVATDGRGREQAAGVVYILNEDLNNSNIGQNNLYAGRLDQIIPDKLLMKEFYLMNKNQWESFNDQKELFYDNDTDIYDVDEGKKVSAKEFYTMDYAVEESSGYAKSRGLKDWYGYIFSDGDRISSIMVQKNLDSMLRQRVSTGQIEAIENDPLVGWKLKLMNSCDWSSLKEKWMERSVSTPINIDKAMLIRDGRMVSRDTLKPGDRLYIVRDDYNAKVVVVK